MIEVVLGIEIGFDYLDVQIGFIRVRFVGYLV